MFVVKVVESSTSIGRNQRFAVSVVEFVSAHDQTMKWKKEEEETVAIKQD